MVSIEFDRVFCFFNSRPCGWGSWALCGPHWTFTGGTGGLQNRVAPVMQFWRESGANVNQLVKSLLLFLFLFFFIKHCLWVKVNLDKVSANEVYCPLADVKSSFAPLHVLRFQPTFYSPTEIRICVCSDRVEWVYIRVMSSTTTRYLIHCHGWLKPSGKAIPSWLVWFKDSNQNQRIKLITSHTRAYWSTVNTAIFCQKKKKNLIEEHVSLKWSSTVCLHDIETA